MDDADPDFDERETIDITGLFPQRDRHEAGLPLHPFMSDAELSTVLVPGNTSKFTLGGCWICSNKECQDLFGMLQGEREVVLTEDSPLYFSEKECTFCHLPMVFVVVAGYILQITEKHIKDLKDGKLLPLFKQPTHLGPSDGSVGTMSVLVEARKR